MEGIVIFNKGECVCSFEDGNAKDMTLLCQIKAITSLYLVSNSSGVTEE